MRSFRVWLPRLVPLVFGFGGLVPVGELVLKAAGPWGIG
jgi:hypothetical protein